MARVKLVPPPADVEPAVAEVAVGARGSGAGQGSFTVSEPVVPGGSAVGAASTGAHDESGPRRAMTPPQRTSGVRTTKSASKVASKKGGETSQGVVPGAHLLRVADALATFEPEPGAADPLRRLREELGHDRALIPTNVRLPEYLAETAASYCDRNGRTGPTFQNLMMVLLDAYLRDAGALPSRMDD